MTIQTVVILPALIYCGGGNARFAEAAIAAGYKYGARLPCTTYAPLYFADQDWKAPDRLRYMAALQAQRPQMATVLDWERDDQLGEILGWAEEAAQYVEQVLIVPKVQSGIDRLPRRINGKEIVLAFSVPTRYGGTELPLWEFGGWPVHLLGGSPHSQMNYWHHLAGIADIVSADGNMCQKMATQYGRYWCPGTSTTPNDRYWQRLKDVGYTDHDAPLEAFRRSCANIMAAWRALA